MNGIEVLDRNALAIEGVIISEKLANIHKAFETKVTPENGVFGAKRVDMGSGVEKMVGKTPDGHTCTEYYRNGKLYAYREALGNHRTFRIDYDDLGQAYLKTFSEAGKNKTWELSPNATIKKGNFTAQTDAYGRLISTKMTDVSINQGARKEVTELKDSTYKPGRDVGHGVPARLNGPGTKENTFAQYESVNRGAIKKVENIAVKLKQDGHTVDYEMRAVYSGTKGKEPLYFEPHITVDGNEYTLDPEYRKIYNIKDDFIHKAVIDAKDKFGTANEIGMKSGLIAAGLTCTISTVDNISQCVNGDITGEEAALGIVKDTAVAGGVGYGTAFVSIAVSETMKGSSQVLIQKIGGTCLPAAVASFAVTSCGSVMDYATGEIDGAELTYELGDSAAMVAGGLAGAKVGADIGATIGAAVGSVVVPGVGTGAGIAVGTVAGGIVGGVVGTVVASSAYATAVELGTAGAEHLGEQAEHLAKETVELFKENIPDLGDSAKEAFNDFFKSCNLSIAV